MLINCKRRGSLNWSEENDLKWAERNGCIYKNEMYSVFYPKMIKFHNDMWGQH